MTPEQKKVMYFVGGGLLLAALLYKPKKADASTGNPKISGPNLGTSKTATFMPTDKALIIQKNINRFYTDKTPENGVFDSEFWSVYEGSRLAFSFAALYAMIKGFTDLQFFEDANIFYEISDSDRDSDKVTFRLHGSNDTVTLRKSLYDLLSSRVFIENLDFTRNDDKAWLEFEA